MFAAVTAERLRKLEALAARPGTPAEGAAALAAIERIRARSPDHIDQLIGMRLRLDRTCDRAHPCCDRHGRIHPGAGPHPYALRCSHCGRHRGWLPKRAAVLLRAMLDAGKLTSSPILRDGSPRP